jgi:hypothetical protein
MEEDGGGAGFAFGPAPRDDGLVYPGAIPDGSFLFTGDHVEPLPGLSATGGGTGLDERLAELGAVAMDAREPVLAYGSNRSPAQLRHKFAADGLDGADLVVPVLTGRIDGVSVVHAAAVAWYGAVPAALTPDPDASTEVAVTFLDAVQLEVVDASERGHDRVELDGVAHPLVLDPDAGIGAGDAAAALSGCRCYWSPRPVLTVDGEPARLAAVGSAGSAFGARSQAEVQQLLLRVWAAAGLPFASVPAFVAAVRADEDLRARVRAALDALVDQPVGADGAIGAIGARPNPAPPGSRP